MPWLPKDATRFTKKANTRAKKKLWAKVADRVLFKTGNDRIAIMSANAAVKRKKK